MSAGQTVRLVGPSQRRLAHQLIDAAPDGAVFNVREATRTTEQNSKLHAMLSDVARAKPGGRVLPVDTWKLLFAAAVGHKLRWEPAHDGDGVVPIGMKTSRMTKAQIAEIIEAIYAFGSQHNVRWSEPSHEREGQQI